MKELNKLLVEILESDLVDTIGERRAVVFAECSKLYREEDRNTVVRSIVDSDSIIDKYIVRLFTSVPNAIELLSYKERKVARAFFTAINKTAQPQLHNTYLDEIIKLLTKLTFTYGVTKVKKLIPTEYGPIIDKHRRDQLFAESSQELSLNKLSLAAFKKSNTKKNKWNNHRALPKTITSIR